MTKAECIVRATWTSNRQNERHVLLVIPTSKGGYELLPFEGGIKLLKGFATVSSYKQQIVNGVEEEHWDIAFDGKKAQGFEVDMETIARSSTKGTLIAAMRSMSLQMVRMQTQDGIPLGRLPMNPLVHISDKQIEAVAARILKSSSPRERGLRQAA